LAAKQNVRHDYDLARRSAGTGIDKV